MTKINKTLWFVDGRGLLNKDNLAERHWTRGKKCVFCDTVVSVEN